MVLRAKVRSSRVTGAAEGGPAGACDENPAERRASASRSSTVRGALRDFPRKTACAKKHWCWHCHCDSIGRSSGSAARNLSSADGGRHSVGTGGGLRYVRRLFPARVHVADTRAGVPPKHNWFFCCMTTNPLVVRDLHRDGAGAGATRAMPRSSDSGYAGTPLPAASRLRARAGPNRIFESVNLDRQAGEGCAPPTPARRL